MSIRDLIRSWTQGPAQSLWWHESDLPGEEVKRFMLLSDTVRSALREPWASVTEQRRMGELKAFFDTFIFGQTISVANDPYVKEKTAYIARVDPVEDDIWDLRSIDPKPGVRVLGCFSERDTFIALVWAYRKDLDGPGGPLWSKFVGQARHQWNHLFKGLKPHTGVQTSDYVSDNFYDV